MNKKTTYLFLALIGIVGIATASASENQAKQYSTTEITASSGTLFYGGGWIKSIQLSSPTESNIYGRDWIVLFDSPTTTPNWNYTAITSAKKKTVPLVYTSTVSAVNPNYFEWQAPGIFISSAASWFKTQSNSGEAFKAIINWTK